VKIKVPANVAFQFSIVDANGRRISPVHGNWLQLRPGETRECNGCHQPATQANPQSHGRSGLFASVNPGAPATGQPFFTGGLSTISPDQGETMAQARARQSCSGSSSRCGDLNLSMAPTFTDVWTDPTQRTPDPDIINLSYADTSFTTLPPTMPTACNTTWASTCRIVINYTQHIQPLWDKVRQVVDPNTNAVLADNTCARAGCHDTTDAMAAAMVPAGQLDLQAVASDEQPLQLRSYRELFFTITSKSLIWAPCRTCWCRVLRTRTATRHR
jgi:hypothetical protein